MKPFAEASMFYTSKHVVAMSVTLPTVMDTVQNVHVLVTRCPFYLSIWTRKIVSSATIVT